MPRRKEDDAHVDQLDLDTSMSTAVRCGAPFLDALVAWLTDSVANERDSRAVKLGTAVAVRGDVTRFLAASLRGEVPRWRAPTAAGARDHRGSALRSALLKEEFGVALAAWASERLAAGTVTADTLRRTLNSILM